MKSLSQFLSVSFDGFNRIVVLAGLLAAGPLATQASAATAALAISTTSLPAAAEKVAYSQALAATGGKSPYTWNLTSGALPAGITLKGTGMISGTPTAAGTFSVQVQVTDSASSTKKEGLSLKVNAPPPPLAILYPSLNSGIVGTAYTQALYATGGSAPYTWSFVSGTLPPGLVLLPGGSLAGTPTVSGSFTFTAQVKDAASAVVTQVYSDYMGAPPLSIVTPAVDPGTVGAAYSKTLNAAGGTPPYSWSCWYQPLPPGLSLSPDGILSGTPTQPGDYSFQVEAADANSVAATINYDLYVNPAPLSVVTTSLPSGQAGSAYAATLLPTGGYTPYTWTVSAGALPPGLSLSAAGVISGTPSAAATATFSVSVTDEHSVVATASLSLEVAAAPAGTGGDGSGGSGSAGTGGSGTGTGGTGAPPPADYTVSVVSGTIGSTGTSTGSFATGTVVSIVADPAPANESFQGWTGSAVADPTAPATTVTVGTSDVTATASYYTGASISQPVAGHPRLWITASDLPRLQSWATASNPAYQQGMLPLLNQAVADYQTFFPGGTGSPSDVPNAAYPDPGDSQGYTGLISEQYALIFGFNALIDPSPAARILHAQRARNLIMVAMNQAVLGPLAGAPFRDPTFPIYNRASATSEAWPLVIDWIYTMTDSQGNPILTASDKATIQKVFLLWATECLNASTTGGDHPEPIGVENSQSLLPGGNAYRMASNNYYIAHGRLVTLMSLALDPADDPAVNPALPVSVLGNSVRSYIANATGAWLYQEYAMMGDPAQVISDYGLAPNASVGLSSGGLPPEGMLYGESFATLMGQLLALKTAGFADPALSGPQVSLANNAPVWDRFAQGYIASLTPTNQVYPGYEYMGPVYELCSYGDILRLWVTPNAAQMYGLLGLLDQKNGVSSRLNAERWFLVNALEGGSSYLTSRMQNPWSYGVQSTLMYYLLLDPTAAAATDPRPGYPTAFYDAPQGRLVEHSDWTTAGSTFDYRLSWISINHQEADGNGFEFYRKGEWLTKTVANYDNNGLGLTTDYHNTLSIQNFCPAGTPELSWFEGPAWSLGSQWQLGEAAGDPAAVVSVQPAYTYVYGDATNLYNRPDIWSVQESAVDVLHASRSIFWLKPDFIVVYDRATSQTPGLFKHFNLSLVSASQPQVVSANGQTVITTTTAGGQHLYATSLLPATATATLLPVGPELNPIAELEPTNYRISISDASVPLDSRFLHVLQGADASVPAAPATLLQSSSGTVFDGVLVSGSVVLFKHNDADAFTGVAYAEPAGVTAHYVAGLVPGAGYTVTTQAAGAATQVTIQPGGSTVADSAGVITF